MSTTDTLLLKIKVMGYHGSGAIRKLAMGSAACKVLATNTVPVLIVRYALNLLSRRRATWLKAASAANGQ